MDGKVVVGVGNIYANEALFMAGIHPCPSAGRVAAARYEHIAGTIKQVLADAIEQGGTTLRDFVGRGWVARIFCPAAAGIWSRQGKPCRVCQHPLKGNSAGGTQYDSVFALSALMFNKAA